jgi:Spy/CpxP family protein refolding chaperone
MRKSTLAVAAAALTFGVFSATGCAHNQQAAPTPHPKIAYTQNDGSTPARPLDCFGSTGYPC